MAHSATCYEDDLSSSCIASFFYINVLLASLYYVSSRITRHVEGRHASVERSQNYTHDTLCSVIHT